MSIKITNAKGQFILFFGIFSLIVLIFAGLYVVVLRIQNSPSLNQQSQDNNQIDNGQEKLALNKFSSCQELHQAISQSFRDSQRAPGVFENVLPGLSGTSQNGANAPVANSNQVDFSSTNNQVKGIDEEDIVKTNGKYIFSVVDANQTNQFYTNRQFSPQPSIKVLEVDSQNGNLGVVGEVFFGNSFSAFSNPQLHLTQTHLILSLQLDYNNSQIIIYDISEASLEGLKNGTELPIVEIHSLNSQIKTSRNYDGALHYILTKVSDPFIASNTYNQEQFKKNLPSYRSQNRPHLDPTDSQNCQNIVYDQSNLRLNFRPVFNTILSFDINNITKQPAIEVIYGSSETIYMSDKAIYLAEKNYNNYQDFQNGSVVNTKIYKFDLQNKKAIYKTRGQVEGSLLNQYSMDEYEGNLRVATTLEPNQPIRPFDIDIFRPIINPGFNRPSTRNSVYILDSNLKQIGAVENLGITERIYAVRYLGPRAFVVTFRQTDPLYTLDLSQANNPRLIGELKIPGYSDFLYPIDDKTLLGIGKQATENGQLEGVKISLFDINDPFGAKQIDFVEIGNSQTTTLVSTDPKALLWDERNGVLALPIRLNNYPIPYSEINQYQDYNYQGSYVYRIRNNKIEFVGRQSHAYSKVKDPDSSVESFKLRDVYINTEKKVYNQYNQVIGTEKVRENLINSEFYNNFNQNYRIGEIFDVKRQIYINQNLYTISQLVIMGNRIDGFENFTQIQFDLTD